MDYKEKYEKALERARKLQENSNGMILKKWLWNIFPELKESEGEKVRNEIIAFVEQSIHRGGGTPVPQEQENKWIAWLEKAVTPTHQDWNGYKDKPVVLWNAYVQGFANGMERGKEAVKKRPQDYGLEKQGEKDKLIQELGEYKVKYIQETLEKALTMNNKDDKRLRKTTIAFLKEFADKGYENAVECIAWLENQGGEQNLTLPKWKYKKDNTPLLRDSLILNKYGCVAKSPSGALVSDVWVIDYAELAKLPKEEIENQGEQKHIIEGTFINVDEVREDFMQEVYRVLDADSTNDRANQIINAFDHLPTTIIQKPVDKQGKKPQGKSALEAINEEKADNQNCAKPAELGKNRSKELSLSLQIQAYLNTASDELYAKGKPLYSESNIEDIHQCMLMWQKLHKHYFYEQKPTDKVEQRYIPKFHVGNKLVSIKNPSLTYEVLEVGHINELGNPEYKVEIFTDGKVSNPRNIHYMECYKVDEWAKLIEQKPAEWHREDEQNLNACLGYIPDEFLRRWLMDVVHVKYDKPADKAEPKFHEGEWCIDDEDGTIFQIVKVLDNTYTYKTNEGKEYSCSHYSLENDARLWTIADAKDGDVLTWDDSTCVVLFKSIKNNKCFISYCFANDITFEMGTSHYIKGCHPATKEQRDLLFQKMSEAGYEWNTVKKLLKKIEHTPAWSEEDEKEVAVLEAYIRSKDWSEKHIDRALGIIDELVNKVKSLRPQNT